MVFIPKQPDHSRFFVNVNGVPRLSSAVDNQTTTQNLFMTPFERSRQNQLQGLFSRAFTGLDFDEPSRLRRLDDFEKSLFETLKRPLEEERNKATRVAEESFNARGLFDSSGFEDFRKEKIEDTFSEGLQEAASQAFQGRNALFDRELAQNLSLLNFAQGGLQQDFANQLGLSGQGLQGSQFIEGVINNRQQNLLAQRRLSLLQDQIRNQSRNALFGNILNSFGPLRSIASGVGSFLGG